MHPYCRVVLSGNGADELFTGYQGDEKLRTFDGLRRRLRILPDGVYRCLPAARRAGWDHVRLGGLSIPDWAKGDMMGYARAFTADSAVLDECEEAVSRLANEFAEAGIETMMDFVMHRALLVSAADTNYRLPDITGYAAEVEVRSPFLDYRLVEFAARLPHRFKVGRHCGRLRAKYLPRRYYERFVGPEIAWGQKRGMGANLNWGPEFAENVKFQEALAAAYQGLREAGLETEPFREAYERYSDAVRCKDKHRPTAGMMMNGFLLGAWLVARDLSTMRRDSAESLKN
jgi:asparagine synthase (glutamine-hydrolysing)